MLQHTSNSLLPCTASSLPPWALLLGTAHLVVVAAAHSSSRLAGPHPRRYKQCVSSHRHRRRCAGHCPACELRRWEEQRGTGQRGTGRRCRLVSFRVIAVLVGVAWLPSCRPAASPSRPTATRRGRPPPAVMARRGRPSSGGRACSTTALRPPRCVRLCHSRHCCRCLRYRRYLRHRAGATFGRLSRRSRRCGRQSPPPPLALQQRIPTGRGI